MLKACWSRSRSLIVLVVLSLVSATQPVLLQDARAAENDEAELVVTNAEPGDEPEGRFRGRTQLSDEIVGRRTRTSRTRATDYGALQTEIFPISIHYRDNGKWKQIRNELVSSSAERHAYENAANRYRLLLPQAIEGAPVRINYKGQVATFSLQGASGHASVSDNEASYPDALPGVDVVYSARNDSVKEKLLIKDVNATSAFEWNLTTSAGLDVRETAVGGLEFFSTSSGDVLFTVPQPFIQDASDSDAGIAPPHAFELSESGGRKSIQLTIDGSWLNDPARQFPVAVDPETVFATRDCWIRSKYPNANTCSHEQLRVGWNGSDTKRALIKFGFGKFPENAEVLHAEFAMHLLEDRGDDLALDLVFRPITEAWGTGVTWNDPWSSAGGVWDWTKGYKSQDVNQGPGWHYWHPTDLVKEWIAGTTPNRGAIIKARYEDIDKTLWFASTEDANDAVWPRLRVTWDHGGMGEFPTYKLEDHQLTDMAHLHANVAGGNLMLHHTDMTLRGKAGLDLKIDRYFNGLPITNFLDTESNVGEGWTLSTAGDIGLKIYRDDSVAFFGESGYRLAFSKDTSYSSLKSPPGLKADLKQRADGWVLTWRQSKEKFFFNTDGHFIRHEGKNGNSIRFVYSGTKVDYIVDSLGRTTDLDYDSTSGQLLSITDPIGRQHLYGYDGNKLISYTNPEGETYEYGYDEASENLNVFKDPRAANTSGNETHFSYESNDYISQIKYVTDSTTTTPTGHTTSFAYESSSGTICNAEQKAPHLTIVTDPRGNQTRYCYTKISRVREIWDARKNLTEYRYNSEANVERFIDAQGREFNYGYDQTDNDLISGQAPGQQSGDTGEAVEVNYGDDGHDHDGDGNTSDEHKHLPVKTIDARGYHTNFRYDSNHNLTAVHQTPKSEDIEFTYGYDGNGNLVRIEAPQPEPDPLDANGNETQGNDTIFEYYADDNTVDGDDGMLRSIDRPDAGGLGDVSYEYDGASRVVATTDGKGQRTEIAYDAVDRLKSITYADLTSITYSYDAAGNLIERNDRDGSIHQFAYDQKNQLNTHTRPDASVVDYNYNKVGEVNQVTDRTKTTKYRYDVTNVLDKVIEPDADEIVLKPNKAYEYWQIVYPNGVTYDVRRYGSGNIKRIWATPPGSTTRFRELTYDYNDSNGNGQGLVQSIVDKHGKETSFTYDPVARVDQEETLNSDGTLHRRFVYDYDKNSNRTLEKTTYGGSTTTTNFHYNHANQLTCSYSGSRSDCGSVTSKTTYDHDGNGSLTVVDDPDKAPKQFGYDAADHTRTVDNPDGTSVEMDYQDATQDERAAKTVKDDADTVTQEVDYDYDLFGLARETRNDGTSEETIDYLRTPDGRLLGQRTSGGDEYYVLDHLGSVRDVTDDAGNVAQKYTYEPYGRIYWQKSADYDNTWRFAQGYFDSDISRYKLGVRYYGFAQGRFTQFDPMAGQIANPVTLNRYQYGNCDPANNVDPTGLEVCSPGELARAAHSLADLGIVLATTSVTSASVLAASAIAALATVVVLTVSITAIVAIIRYVEAGCPS